jgi:hypothetical protein
MESEPKQTTPKGAEIPVPKRGDWEKVLRKAAKPKGSTPSGTPKQ